MYRSCRGPPVLNPHQGLPLAEKILQQQRSHERLNGELAHILDSIRGIQDPESHLFKLIILHHNFIRPYMGLGGKTSAAASGITIEGPTWMTLIENAALLKRDKERKENQDKSTTPVENATLCEAPMAA